MEDNAENEETMDDIIRSVRAAAAENKKNPPAQQNEEVFVLSESMLVKREDIPYRMGVWTFDDVAAKMIKKYRVFFNGRFMDAVRTQARENTI